MIYFGIWLQEVNLPSWLVSQRLKQYVLIIHYKLLTYLMEPLSAETIEATVVVIIDQNLIDDSHEGTGFRSGNIDS